MRLSIDRCEMDTAESALSVLDAWDQEWAAARTTRPSREQVDRALEDLRANREAERERAQARATAAAKRAARHFHIQQMLFVGFTYPSIMGLAGAMGEIRGWLAACRLRWDHEEIDWWMRMAIYSTASHGIAGLNSVVTLSRIAALESGDRDMEHRHARDRVRSLFTKREFLIEASVNHRGYQAAVLPHEDKFRVLSVDRLPTQDELMKNLKRMIDVEQVLVPAVRRAARDSFESAKLTTGEFNEP